MTESITYARPYAEAAYKIAIQDKSISSWSESLKSLTALVNDSQVKAILASPKVNDADKLELLLSGLKDKKNTSVSKFLEILIENKKIYHVSMIENIFNEMILTDDNVFTATVETAYKLTSDQKDKLKTKLEKQYDKQIQIDEILNKNLIAGIKIHVNNQVIDHSIKFKIDSMREQIIDNR